MHEQRPGPGRTTGDGEHRPRAARHPQRRPSGRGAGGLLRGSRLADLGVGTRLALAGGLLAVLALVVLLAAGVSGALLVVGPGLVVIGGFALAVGRTAWSSTEVRAVAAAVVVCGVLVTGGGVASAVADDTPFAPLDLAGGRPSPSEPVEAPAPAPTAGATEEDGAGEQSAAPEPTTATATGTGTRTGAPATSAPPAPAPASSTATASATPTGSAPAPEPSATTTDEAPAPSSSAPAPSSSTPAPSSSASAPAPEPAPGSGSGDPAPSTPAAGGTTTAPATPTTPFPGGAAGELLGSLG